MLALLLMLACGGGEAPADTGEPAQVDLPALADWAVMVANDLCYGCGDRKADCLNAAGVALSYCSEWVYADSAKEAGDCLEDVAAAECPPVGSVGLPQSCLTACGF